MHRVDAPADRPERELRRFAKVAVAAGATETVAFELDDRCFSEWADGWTIPDASWEVRIGRSSRDLRARRRDHAVTRLPCRVRDPKEPAWP